jgi:hypothetical protein
MSENAIEKIDKEAFELVKMMQSRKWSWIQGRALEIFQYANKADVKVDSFEVYSALRKERFQRGSSNA